MDDLSEEFIRRVIALIAAKSPTVCKEVCKMLVEGDHCGIKEFLPEAFE